MLVDDEVVVASNKYFRPLNIDLYQQICCEKNISTNPLISKASSSIISVESTLPKTFTRFWNMYKWYIFPIDWWFCAMANFSNETIFSLTRYTQHTKTSRRRFDKKFFRFWYFHTFSILFFIPIFIALSKSIRFGW